MESTGLHDRATGAADERGRVENNFIDPAAREGGGVDLAATLDQNGHDTSVGKVPQNRFERLVPEHEGAVSMHVGENFRGGRKIAGLGENDAPWLLLARAEGMAADGEGRIVLTDSFRADEDGFTGAAQKQGIGAGGGASEPWSFPGRSGDAAVKAHAGFGNHPRQARREAFGKRAKDFLAFRPASPG